jgi:hypothetical protein
MPPSVGAGDLVRGRGGGVPLRPEDAVDATESVLAVLITALRSDGLGACSRRGVTGDAPGLGVCPPTLLLGVFSARAGTGGAGERVRSVDALEGCDEAREGAGLRVRLIADAVVLVEPLRRRRGAGDGAVPMLFAILAADTGGTSFPRPDADGFEEGGRGERDRGVGAGVRVGLDMRCDVVRARGAIGALTLGDPRACG